MQKNSIGYSAPAPYAEKGDCVVRALMVALNCRYEAASAVLSAAGRKVRAGTEREVVRKVCSDWLGMEEVKMPLGGLTVAEFTLLYDSGAYVVLKHRHAFAIVDEVIHDWERGSDGRTRLVAAWKVTEKARAKIAALNAIL